MSYITWDEVVARYEKIADLSGASAVSSTFIAYAQAEVEGRLGHKYTTPFSNNNLTVKDLCIDLTLARVIKYKDTKKFNEIMKSVDKTINDLLTGKMVMSTVGGTLLPQESNIAWSETEDYLPVFFMGDIEDMVVDSSMLVDEEDARSI